jgi:hyperosmotically inducible protein
MFRQISVMVLVAGSLVAASGHSRAESSGGMELATGAPVDNTERNVRDKAGTTVTPENQKETKKDLKVTANIRKAVVKNKSLSVDAHNVKIVTRDGVVTLRGPVESKAENDAVEKIAKHTRGVRQVNNELEIKNP